MPLRIVALFVAALPLCAEVGDEIPQLHGTTLSGRKIEVPGGQNIAAYVLSFGFSHKSDKAVEAWDKLIAPVYTANSRVAYFEMPELQGVPGFINTMILHGMRKAVPKAEHDRFAPIYNGESELKQIVGFSDPKAAYVVVTTEAGKVVWMSHAPASDAVFAELRNAVTELLK